jgi:acetate kinase
MPAPPREVKRMHEPILVINAGSSGIKFSVFETGADRSPLPAAHGEVEGIGTASRLSVMDPQGCTLAERPVAGDDYESAIAAIHNWFRPAGADASSTTARWMAVEFRPGRW